MRIPIVACLLAWLAASAASGPAAAAQRGAPPNRLIDSGSPYLLQHAYNPVDWHPWGPEALDKARREGKPIFVSVGYSTCYWCHVANRTLFENPEIAALMNAWFVNIKIDREQRPDLDRVLMEATRALTGSGGWPNQVFLTPELEPFFAGSYFPPEDDDVGRPGFPSVLKRIHEDWTARRDEVREKARLVAARLRSTTPSAANTPVRPDAWRAAGLQAWLARSDDVHGGFRMAGGAKFPQAPALAFLLAEHRARPRPALLRAVTHALDAMAAGGIHDHLGGGFHRYSVEASWSVPHFEKMLYENAQLLALYAEAWRLTGKPRYREVAAGIAMHLARDMEAPEGGFFTALDAASGGEEGRAYLWRTEDIEAALGADAARKFLGAFELAAAGARESAAALDDETRGVLRLRAGAALPAGFEAQRRRLLAARLARPQPERDEKLVLALNGLAVAAFADSGRLLAERTYIERARRAAERLWSAAWNERAGSLAHEIFRGRAQGEGLLEDYALFARGLLALHEATGEARWRQRAQRLAAAALRGFARADGRLAASRESAPLPLAPEDAEDYAYPSGTSALLEVLLRLGEREHLAAAGRLLRALGGTVEGRVQRWPALLGVLAGREAAAGRALTVAPSRVEAQAPSPGDSASRVSVVARLEQTASADRLEVTLGIEPGWHVNANPASFDFLVPTKLLLEGTLPRRVIYPPGRPFKARFAPDVLSVYEGKAVIVAEFPSGALRAGSLKARLSVQACNETVCLPPGVVGVPVQASR